MSKAVLLSIRPKWCEKIARGEKTIEVRKTRPKLETPFKAYIYCTMPDAKDPHNILELHGADGRSLGSLPVSGLSRSHTMAAAMNASVSLQRQIKPDEQLSCHANREPLCT